MPVTIPVTLPDELAERAKTKGLLSPSALAIIIGEAVGRRDMDPRLEGAVNPLAFKLGKIVGDVIDPINAEWEADA